jgi:hypothetical protein
MDSTVRNGQLSWAQSTPCHALNCSRIPMEEKCCRLPTGYEHPRYRVHGVDGSPTWIFRCLPFQVIAEAPTLMLGNKDQQPHSTSTSTSALPAANHWHGPLLAHCARLGLRLGLLQKSSVDPAGMEFMPPWLVGSRTEWASSIRRLHYWVPRHRRRRSLGSRETDSPVMDLGRECQPGGTI